MEAFLAILSVIGRVLLIILIVIVILIALLLFTPFVYRVKIRKTEQLNASGSVKWLFGAIWLKYSFTHGKTDWSLRVFGFPLDRRFKGGKQKKDGKKKEKPEEEFEPAKKQPVIPPSRKEYGQIAKLSEDEAFEEPRKQGIFEKIRLTFARIRDILEKAGEFKTLFMKIRPILFKLLKHIWPKKVQGTIEFGLEDPAATGMLLGFVAALCLPIPKKLRITPDFQKAGFECDVKISGRIFLIYLLIQGIRLLRMPEVRKLIQSRRKSRGPHRGMKSGRRKRRKLEKRIQKRKQRMKKIKEAKAQKETGNGGK